MKCKTTHSTASMNGASECSDRSSNVRARRSTRVNICSASAQHTTATAQHRLPQSDHQTTDHHKHTRSTTATRTHTLYKHVLLHLSLRRLHGPRHTSGSRTPPPWRNSVCNSSFCGSANFVKFDLHTHTHTHTIVNTATNNPTPPHHHTQPSSPILSLCRCTHLHSTLMFMCSIKSSNRVDAARFPK